MGRGEVQQQHPPARVWLRAYCIVEAPRGHCCVSNAPIPRAHKIDPLRWPDHFYGGGRRCQSSAVVNERQPTLAGGRRHVGTCDNCACSVCRTRRGWPWQRAGQGAQQRGEHKSGSFSASAMTGRPPIDSMGWLAPSAGPQAHSTYARRAAYLARAPVWPAIKKIKASGHYARS